MTMNSQSVKLSSCWPILMKLVRESLAPMFERTSQNGQTFKDLTWMIHLFRRLPSPWQWQIIHPHPRPFKDLQKLQELSKLVLECVGTAEGEKKSVAVSNCSTSTQWVFPTTLCNKHQWRCQKSTQANATERLKECRFDAGKGPGSAIADKLFTPSQPRRSHLSETRVIRSQVQVWHAVDVTQIMVEEGGRGGGMNEPEVTEVRQNSWQ